MMRSAKKTYEIDMLHGAILPKLLRFAVPLTLSTMLQLLFNAADVVVVGRWAGDNSLAAVGSNTSLIALLTNMFLGLSIGANILAARYFGAHEDEELSKTVHTSILLSLYSGVFLTVVGILGARTILIWMQCPANVLDLATLYLRIYFAGMTATMLYNFGAALLRASGDTQRPLYYLFASGVVNVILNLVFVIYFHMDVAGVALATVISQCISAALVVRCLVKETGPLRLDFRQLKIYPIKLKQIMQVGIPAGIQGMLFSLANVTVQSSVNSFGEVIMAGSSAAISIEQFIYSNINAFYQANVAFTSQNYGVGKLKRMDRVLADCMILSVVVAVVLGCICYGFGPEILQIYTEDAEVIACGMEILAYTTITYFLCGWMDLFPGALRGMGYSAVPMVLSVIGTVGTRVVWIFGIFPYHRSLAILFISYPASWIITIVLQVICFYFVRRRVHRRSQALAGQEA